MKTVKDKQVLVGADFAGFPLKEVVAEHLRKKGWTVTDIGVKSADEKEPEMFHRIGLKVGAKISEGEFERALIFCALEWVYILRQANVRAFMPAWLKVYRRRFAQLRGME